MSKCENCNKKQGQYAIFNSSMNNSSDSCTIPTINNNDINVKSFLSMVKMKKHNLCIFCYYDEYWRPGSSRMPLI